VGYDARQTRVFVVRQGPPRTAKAHKPAHLRTTPAHNHCQPLISDLMVRIRVCHLYKNSTSPLPTLDPASPLPPPPRAALIPSPPLLSPSSAAGLPLLLPPSCVAAPCPSASATERSGSLGDRPASASSGGLDPAFPSPTAGAWRSDPTHGGRIRRVAAGSVAWPCAPPSPLPLPHRGRWWPELLAVGGGGPSSQAREAELLAAGGGGPCSPPELPTA
jgi:hypothetical protein